MNSRFIIIVLGELWLYCKLLCITYKENLLKKRQMIDLLINKGTNRKD